MEDEPLDLLDESMLPDELKNMDETDFLLRLVDVIGNIHQMVGPRYWANHPDQVPDWFTCSGEEQGHLVTPEDCIRAEQIPVSTLDLPPDCTSLLARTGATTLAVLLSQLDTSTFLPDTLPAWHLHRQMEKETLGKLVEALDPELNSVILDCWRLAGPYGTWRETFFRDAISRLNPEDASLLEGMTEREHAEVLDLLSLAIMCPDAHQEIFTDELTCTAVSMYYRYRYSRDYICQSLNLSDRELEHRLDDSLSGAGPACTLFLLSLRRDEAEARRILDGETRPWFCSLLGELFPDVCTDAFFRTWSPPGGLHVQEQAVIGCIRSVACDIPEAGEGELFLCTVRNGEPLRAVCEELNVPIWEARRIETAIRAGLQEEPMRDILLNGFSIGSLALRQLLQRSIYNPEWISHLLFQVVRLPWKPTAFLYLNLARRDLASLASILWPEETLSGIIRERLGPFFPALRAWLLSSGARGVLEKRITEIRTSSSVAGMHSLLISILEISEDYDEMLHLLKQSDPSILEEYLPQLRGYVWGTSPNSIFRPSPETSGYLELALYYEGISFTSLAMLASPNCWTMALDQMKSASRLLAHNIASTLEQVFFGAAGDTAPADEEEEEYSPREPAAAASSPAQRSSPSQQEKKSQLRGIRTRKKKMKKGRKKK